MLKVHEIFNSIQGEGSMMGRPMTFVRLFGCNRSCDYCDQPQGNFVEMEEETIVSKYCTCPAVCLTGGEPLMQDIYKLSFLLESENKELHIETNGDFDNLRRKAYSNKGERIFEMIPTSHLACSPKVKDPKDLKLYVRWIDDLKIIVDETTTIRDLTPWEEFVKNDIVSLWLQPKNYPKEVNWGNLKKCLQISFDRPIWGVSPQLHKLLGVK